MNLNLGDLQSMGRKAYNAASSGRNPMNTYTDKYFKPIMSAGMALAAIMVMKGCWDDICKTIKRPSSDFGRGHRR